MLTRRQNFLQAGALMLALMLLATACSSNSDDEASGAAPEAASADQSEGETETAAGSDSENAAAEEETGDAATIVVDGESAPSPGSMIEEVGEVLTETGEGLSGADLEQYLAQRYEAYWQAFDLARRAPTENPGADYPELATLVAGEQLESTYGELVALSGLGHAIRDPEAAAVPGLDANSAHRIRIESLESGVAELVSCLVNDQVRYDVATGEVLSDRIVTVQTETTMAKADGTWKIIRSAAVGLDDGVASCWLEPEESFPL